MDKQEIMRRMQQALCDDVAPVVPSAPRASLISNLSRMKVRLGKSIKKRLKKLEGLVSRPFRWLRKRLFHRAQRQFILVEQLNQMIAAQSQQSLSQPNFWDTITECWKLDRIATPVATHESKSQSTDTCRREAA